MVLVLISASKRRSVLRFLLLSSSQGGKKRASAGHRPFPLLILPSSLLIPLTHAREQTRKGLHRSPPTTISGDPDHKNGKKSVRATRSSARYQPIFFFILHPLILFFYIFPAAYPQGQGKRPYPLLFFLLHSVSHVVFVLMSFMFCFFFVAFPCPVS